MSIKTEICIDTVESAIIAEKAGADELEVCYSLDIGGITPSIGLLEEVKKETSLPLNVIIRPRSGDFLYSEYEKNLMLRDIKKFVNYDINGIVVGALDSKGRLDLEFLKECRKIVKDRKLTFHKAFDMVKDMEESLKTLIDLGYDRILTSGGKKNSLEGKENIRKLQELGNGRIEIMAGGGVRPENIKEILEYTDIKNIHFSAKKELPSKMEFKNLKVSMSGNEELSEYGYAYTDYDSAKEMIDLVKEI